MIGDINVFDKAFKDVMGVDIEEKQELVESGEVTGTTQTVEEVYTPTYVFKPQAPPAPVKIRETFTSRMEIDRFALSCSDDIKKTIDQYVEDMARNIGYEIIKKLYGDIEMYQDYARDSYILKLQIVVESMVHDQESTLKNQMKNLTRKKGTY